MAKKKKKKSRPHHLEEGGAGRHHCVLPVPVLPGDDLLDGRLGRGVGVVVLDDDDDDAALDHGGAVQGRGVVPVLQIDDSEQGGAVQGRGVVPVLQIDDSEQGGSVQGRGVVPVLQIDDSEQGGSVQGRGVVPVLQIDDSEQGGSVHGLGVVPVLQIDDSEQGGSVHGHLALVPTDDPKQRGTGRGRGVVPLVLPPTDDPLRAAGHGAGMGPVDEPPEEALGHGRGRGRGLRLAGVHTNDDLDLGGVGVGRGAGHGRGLGPADVPPNQVPDLVGAGRGAGRRSGRKDIVVGAASQDAAAGGGQQGADPPRNLMDNSDLPEPKRSGKKGNRRNKGYLPLDEYEIPPDEVCEVPCLGVGVSETMNGGSRTDSQNGGGFLYKLDDAGSTSAGGNVIGDGSSRPAKKEERRARQQKGGGYLTSCVDIAGTGVGVDVHLGKQTKMDGSKASLQKGGGDLIAREDTANGVVDPAVEALQKCERFEATVRLITQNIKRQHKIEDIPTVLLHWKPKWKDLVRYRDESIAIYLACCPFAISVKMKNGETKHFPASPAKPEQMEDATHHIIILRRPSDRAEVHLLIEQFSNYLKAFKIVLQGERKEQKRWLILGLRNKLPKRFDPTGNIQNDENYKEVENVTMHKEKFPEIFKFFVSFDVPHPEKRKATQEGRVILSASFVFFCEFIRYRIVGNWMLLGLSRDWNMPLRIPRNFPALLRDWSYLSKLVFALYLAILELPMLHALPEEEKKTCPFIETMPDARKDWKDRQQVQPAISFFFDNEKDMQLEWLCGEHIMLLRHEYASCDKILMRLIGYDGFWHREIQAAMEKKKSVMIKGSNGACSQEVF